MFGFYSLNFVFLLSLTVLTGFIWVAGFSFCSFGGSFALFDEKMMVAMCMFVDLSWFSSNVDNRVVENCPSTPTSPINLLYVDSRNARE